MPHLPAATAGRRVYQALGAVLLALLWGCGDTAGDGATSVGLGIFQERPLERGASDVAIATSLRSAYLQTQFDDLFLKVNVLVVEGRVLLTGTATTDEIKQQAVQIAEATAGIVQVLDEMQVGTEYSAWTWSKDVKISTEIRARLVGELGTDQIDFWTTTHDGVVYLVGIAENRAEVKAVTEIARYVRGVKKVVNHIILRDDPRRLPGVSE